MVEKTVTEPSQKESAHDAAVDSNTQPLLTHLVALRNSIIRSLAAIAILFVPYVIFAKQLFSLIALPLVRNLPGSSPETVGTMISTDVAAPFIVPLKLAFFLAICTAMPYVLHQLWTFIAPGLYLREKRFALPVLLSSIFLFYSGMVFAYFLVFPLIFQFFAASTPENVVWMTDINSYLSFIFKLFFAFGIVFEIPIAIVLLTATRLTTIKTLKKGRPYIFVSCFILGMFLTPPDVVSQILLAIPAWILFEFGLILGRMLVRDSEE
ncbi:MAG: twin-arginine translocase subunit TatC [Gammaproteobacteria bacterium]|nr:twin-arginine translocase subunit TatC [Gammaproteobacteria bacterium]